MRADLSMIFKSSVLRRCECPISAAQSVVLRRRRIANSGAWVTARAAKRWEAIIASILEEIGQK